MQQLGSTVTGLVVGSPDLPRMMVRPLPLEELAPVEVTGVPTQHIKIYLTHWQSDRS